MIRNINGETATILIPAYSYEEGENSLILYMNRGKKNEVKVNGEYMFISSDENFSSYDFAYGVVSSLVSSDGMIYDYGVIVCGRDNVKSDVSSDKRFVKRL